MATPTATHPATARRLLLVALLCLVPAAGPASAQDGDDPGPPLFIDRIDVEIVNVEVFVTDSEGRRVENLGIDDFELFEDGVPVQIANFYSAFRANEAVRRAEEGEPPDARPEEPAEDQRLNLAIYVDHLSLRPAHRKRVLQSLEGFVEERLVQGDRILLLGYDGALQTVTPFTTDRDRVLRGLESMEKVSAVRRADDALRSRTQRLMIQASAETPPDPRAALSYLRSYAQTLESDVQRATGALQSAVRSLAGLPGRKALVYVSDGWTGQPGADLYQFFLDLFGQSGLSGQVLDPTAEIQRYDQSHRFRDISREANAQQVTLYSIDARGTSSGALRADEPGLSANAGGATLLETQRTESAREGLFAMAVSTGGSVAFETFDFAEVFDTLGQDFDGYYSLGYRSRFAGDGKPHRIEVEVKRPGVEVRHRKSFVDKPDVERIADRTLAALTLDAGQNPLGVAVRLGQPERGKKKRDPWIVPVLVAVPIGSVTLVPDGDTLRGRLRFFVSVRDDNGTSEPHSEIYPLEIPADAIEDARDRSLGWGVQLQVRPGTPTVAVGVWDEVAGTESFVLEQVRVGG